ncbi:MAG: hypothetical protein AB7G06_09180 [Bdellovibrionales bacterium]
MTQMKNIPLTVVALAYAAPTLCVQGLPAGSFVAADILQNDDNRLQALRELREYVWASVRTRNAALPVSAEPKSAQQRTAEFRAALRALIGQGARFSKCTELSALGSLVFLDRVDVDGLLL